MADTAARKAPRTPPAVKPGSMPGDHAGMPPPGGCPAAVLGRLVSLSPQGIAQVSTGGGAPTLAAVITQVSRDHLAAALEQGSPVLLVFLDGDARRPVIIGVIGSTHTPARRLATAMVDGQRVELTGQDEVVLTCGQASITLTKAGKVLIKGTHVVSGSTGTNRITGGSVQIN